MATATKKKRKTEKATNLLNVAFIWDMSGSMGVVEQATKQGTETYLKDLQAEEKKLAKKSGDVFTRLSLTVFDTVFEPWVVNEPICDVDVSDLVGRYRHRGMTALYDAIANTITELEDRLRREKRENEKVLVIVMTDGEENSSRDYSLSSGGRQRLFDLIKSYEDKGNWTFVYLGANVDAYKEASAIGIPTGNAAYYASTDASTVAVASAMGNVTRGRRSGATGQTVTAFADAGQSQDYREETPPPSNPRPLRALSEYEKQFADSKSAADTSKSIR